MSRTPRPAGLAKNAAFAPELEGLRGVAILLVFLHHASKPRSTLGQAVLELGERDAQLLDSFVGPLYAFVASGHTGVTLFFILSAYLLSRPFIAGSRPVNVKHFYQKRALRIMPAYVLAVLFAGWAVFGPSAEIVKTLPYLVFGQGFFLVEPMMPYSAVWWSLATEFQFYVVLPWIVLCARDLEGRTGHLVLIGIGLLWLAGYAWLVGFSLDERFFAIKGIVSASLIGQAPAFAVGALCAWLDVRHGARIRARLGASSFLSKGGADSILFGVVIVLGSLIREVARMNYFRAELVFPQWHLVESLLWGVIFLLVLLAPLQTRRPLAGRVLGTVGVLSYSLYLVHLPLLAKVIVPVGIELGLVPETRVLPLPMIALALLVCVAVSAVTYRLIERPFLLRKTRLSE